MTHVIDAQGRIKRGPSNLDARYLRLDCVNDPLTAGLEINAATADEPVLILQTTDDDATNNLQEWQKADGTVLSFIGQSAIQFKPAADSTTFLQVLDADGGTPILNIDTVNKRVGINNVDPDRLFHPEVSDAATNSITYAQRLSHVTSGTAVAGFGTGIEFELEENDGTFKVAGVIENLWTDAGEGANADADFVFKLMQNDGAAAEKVRFLSSGGVVVQDVVRGATSLWWRIQHVDLVNVSKGASAAVWTSLDINHLSGYQLDADTEYLYFNVHVGTDWDEASDLELVVQFETNVNNGGGLVTDTVDFDLLMYYKRATETANKTQTLDASVVVGQAAQYYHQHATFTIDYDKVDHVVQIGDCVSMRLNLDTTDGEVTNVIVHHAMFRYKTNKVRAEV